MAAPLGNQYWKLRASSGAPRKYDNPDDLWTDCVKYFEWVEDNPLMATELVKFQGKATEAKVSKMRAMTLLGLCLFLDITHSTWCDWRNNREDLSEVITRVEEIIYVQKFEGAAADLFNPNIIARELGLSDRSELTGQRGGPIRIERATTVVPDIENMSVEQLQALDKLLVENGD